MIDLTPVFNAVIALVAALVTAFLIPWLQRKATAEQLANARKWVSIAVKAAEMIYKGAGLGEEKKAYVKNYLETKGYKYDENTINALIESAVMELKIDAGWA